MKIISCFISLKSGTAVFPTKSLEKIAISNAKREAAEIFIVGNLMISNDTIKKSSSC